LKNADAALEQQVADALHAVHVEREQVVGEADDLRADAGEFVHDGFRRAGGPRPLPAPWVAIERAEFAVVRAAA